MRPTGLRKGGTERGWCFASGGAGQRRAAVSGRFLARGRTLAGRSRSGGDRENVHAFAVGEERMVEQEEAGSEVRGSEEGSGGESSVLDYVRDKLKVGARSGMVAGRNVERARDTLEGPCSTSSPSTAPAPSPIPDLDKLREALSQLEAKDERLRSELKEQRRLLRDAVGSLSPHRATSFDLEAPPSGDGVMGTRPASTKTCETVHPGAECVTRTSVSISPEGREATVTVQARVSPAPIQPCRSPPPSASRGARAEEELSCYDMVALASLAAHNAAGSLFAQETAVLRGRRRAGDVRGTHEAITKVLREGKVVSSRRSDHVSEFSHESFLVELECPDTGKRMKAFFKPRSEEGSNSGWHRVAVECVAYELNLMLGMDYVPPCAYRREELVIDGTTFHEGVFIYFVEGAQQLDAVPPAGWNAGKDRVLSDTRILDVLIHNSDRHSGHFLHGRHWAAKEGEPSCSAHRPVLIDHAAGFRKDAVVMMDHENAFRTGATRVVSARTYLHLRYLSADALAEKLSPYLNRTEICELRHRKEAIVEFLDGLVCYQGYDSVVIE